MRAGGAKTVCLDFPKTIKVLNDVMNLKATATDTAAREEPGKRLVKRFNEIVEAEAGKSDALISRHARIFRKGFRCCRRTRRLLNPPLFQRWPASTFVEACRKMRERTDHCLMSNAGIIPKTCEPLPSTTNPHSLSRFTSMRSMRRSGISHKRATNTYRPPEIHGLTNASGMAMK